MTWDYGILPWYHVHWAKLLDGYVDKYEKVGASLEFRGSCCFIAFKRCAFCPYHPRKEFAQNLRTAHYHTLQTLWHEKATMEEQKKQGRQERSQQQHRKR